MRLVGASWERGKEFRQEAFIDTSTPREVITIWLWSASSYIGITGVVLIVLLVKL